MIAVSSHAAPRDSAHTIFDRSTRRLFRRSTFHANRRACRGIGAFGFDTFRPGYRRIFPTRCGGGFNPRTTSRSNAAAVCQSATITTLGSRNRGLTRRNWPRPTPAPRRARNWPKSTTGASRSSTINTAG
jgi:hypothetical protein